MKKWNNGQYCHFWVVYLGNHGSWRGFRQSHAAYRSYPGNRFARTERFAPLPGLPIRGSRGELYLLPSLFGALTDFGGISKFHGGYKVRTHQNYQHLL